MLTLSSSIGIIGKSLENRKNAEYILKQKTKNSSTDSLQSVRKELCGYRFQTFIIDGTKTIREAKELIFWSLPPVWGGDCLKRERNFC